MTRYLLLNNKTANTSSASTSSASTSSASTSSPTAYPSIPQVSNLIYSDQIKQLNNMDFNNHNLNLNGKPVCFKILYLLILINKLKMI